MFSTTYVHVVVGVGVGVGVVDDTALARSKQRLVWFVQEDALAFTFRPTTAPCLSRGVRDRYSFVEGCKQWRS